MTKEEFISKWRNKKIAIENDHAETLTKTITLLGSNLPPRRSAKPLFFNFRDNEYGWDCKGETELPTIKATEALEILTETQPINEPQMDRTPEHYRAHLMQPWDMLVKIYGPKAAALHLRMSAFEYRMRAGYKDDSASDLAKAMHCEAKAKELEGGEE